MTEVDNLLDKITNLMMIRDVRLMVGCFLFFEIFSDFSMFLNVHLGSYVASKKPPINNGKIGRGNAYVHAPMHILTCVFVPIDRSNTASQRKMDRPCAAS